MPAALPKSQPETQPGQPLSECPNGFSGPILELCGPAFLSDRLRELGFVAGEIVRLIGRTPMGEPLIVEARGATIALRKAEAACLRV